LKAIHNRGVYSLQLAVYSWQFTIAREVPLGKQVVSSFTVLCQFAG